MNLCDFDLLEDSKSAGLGKGAACGSLARRVTMDFAGSPDAERIRTGDRRRISSGEHADFTGFAGLPVPRGYVAGEHGGKLLCFDLGASAWRPCVLLGEPERDRRIPQGRAA